jgi:tripartite-type tricarboxylate transporter receptor subunit TctC
VAALNSADLKERLVAVGFDVLGSSPDDFGRFLRNDQARTAKVIKAAGIKAGE